MRLSDISIARPVLSTVMSLVILLVGIVSYDRLTLREYPNIDEPSVTVRTDYPGASAQIMESQVTKILEDSISGIEGIQYTSSISREGTSLITVKFIPSRDPDVAASDVRDRVSRVRGQLPDEIDEPIIAKVEADADPIIWLGLTSNRLTAAQLSDLADRYIQDQLQMIPGVADVMIFGQRRYAMRIWIDPIKLAGHFLTVKDVEDALINQNIDIPSGRVEGAQREFTVLTNTDLNRVEQFEDIIVANRDNHLVRMKDVARVALGVEDDRVKFRFNQQTAVGLGIVKQSVANPLEISDNIEKLLPRLQKSLPEGVTMTVGYNSAVFIKQSIHNVFETLFEAVVLVMLVILLFLRSFRAALVPLVTIPVSLIGAFSIMYALGFSINTLTLLAMVLAIGLVVDDAIVVLENIYRHIEEGMKPLQAAFQGSREIAFAVLAMTVTLAAVYVPVAFLQGRTGKLFVEFALTLAAAVLISGFVALTLSPMMCGRTLRPEHSKLRLFIWIEQKLETLDQSYKRGLYWFLERRFLVFPLLGVIAVVMALLLTNLKSELSPTEDRGVLFMSYVGPEGATVDYMSAYAAQLEKIIASVPEINRFGIVAGVGGGRLPVANQGLSFQGMTPWEERDRSTMEISAGLAPKLLDVPGVLAFSITPASLGANFSSKPVEYVIMDSTSYEVLGANVEKFIAKLRENPNILGIDTDLKINTPQLRVNIDRNRLADLGISVADTGRALETLLAGKQVTRFKQASEQYDVIVQIEEDQRSEPEQLNRIYLRTKSDELVPLSSVVDLKATVAPRDLNHFNRLRSVTLTANLAPSYSLGEALAFMNETAAETLPPTATIDYRGQSREFRESGSSMYVAFMLAVVFIFLVLAAQFESFVDPLVILVTVPLSICGALLALWFTGNTLNIYSQIGLITLVGLITKHGILIVEFANQQQDRGVDTRTAIVEAAHLRLRPILMTTAAMVFGSIPLALATGAGAESRHQIGWVIVGGMTFGTLLTLFVLPSFYSYVGRRRAIDVIPDYEV
ncbi:MAG: efflux RND transporter permease subunit [Rickettsiales bacterium]